MQSQFSTFQKGMNNKLYEVRCMCEHNAPVSLTYILNKQDVPVKQEIKNVPGANKVKIGYI